MSSHFNFFRNSPYNTETKEQIWTTIINDAHDSWCGCCKPFAHLLNLLFPTDHKDRNTPISEIIKREYSEKIWCGGGDAEGAGGEATEDPSTKKEKDIPEKEDGEEGNLEELIAAAEEVEQR